MKTFMKVFGGGLFVWREGRAVDLFLGTDFLNRFFEWTTPVSPILKNFWTQGRLEEFRGILKRGYHTTAKQAAKTEKRQKQIISKLKTEQRF